jgi:hypothetical protein
LYLTEYITEDLTAGHIVELEINLAETIMKHIDQMLRVYSRYKPMLKSTVIHTTPGVQQYQVNTGGFDVLNVEFQTSGIMPGLVGKEFDEFKYPIYEVLSGRGYNQFASVGEIELYQVWLEMIQKVLSANVEWEYDKEHNMIFIHPPPAGDVAAQVTWEEPRTLRTVDWRDEDWAVEYVLALTKISYGRALRKYAQIPGTTMTITTDGEELVKEGMAEKAALEDRILARTQATGTPPFVIG